MLCCCFSPLQRAWNSRLFRRQPPNSFEKQDPRNFPSARRGQSTSLPGSAGKDRSPSPPLRADSRRHGEPPPPAACKERSAAVGPPPVPTPSPAPSPVTPTPLRPTGSTRRLNNHPQPSPQLRSHYPPQPVTPAAPLPAPAALPPPHRCRPPGGRCASSGAPPAPRRRRPARRSATPKGSAAPELPRMRHGTPRPGERGAGRARENRAHRVGREG